MFAFFSCEPPNYPSPCSVKSNVFRNFILFKAATNDKSEFCGFKGTVVNPATTPIDQTVATPVFTPVSGHYNTPQILGVTSATPGASIFFTADRTTPTTASSLYNPNEIVNLWGISGLTIKAIATKTGLPNSAVATAEYSYAPLKTGQTLCYDANVSVTCPGLFDDGHYKAGTTRGYIDNADGTVTDTATGLRWQKCALGLSGPGCTIGSQTPSNFANATSTCSGLPPVDGRSWRLPSYQELQTLINYGLNSPAIDPVFPFTSGSYWSSTTATITSALNAYTINFNTGLTLSSEARTNTLPFVRCVNGMQKNMAPNFIDSGVGTIRDKITGLLWQKCSNGQANDASCTAGGMAIDFVSGLAYCNGLILDGKTWRLPNANELFSLVDVSASTQPPINTTFFIGTPAGAGYWTSTTVQGTSANGWTVSFNNGRIIDSTKTGLNRIRCVSGP